MPRLDVPADRPAAPRAGGAGRPVNRSSRPERYGSRVTEAKDHAQAPAADPETPAAAPAAAAEPQEAAVETDPIKRFRAVLDRKNANPGRHPGSMAAGSNDLKSSNGKRQRQFRRKSGG
jgi:hypothetical protein